MMDLDITFEDAPWESALDAVQTGATVCAAELLTLLEEATEEQTQDALQMLRERHVTLDTGNLPKLPVSGATAVRLRQEQQLVEQGNLFQGLEAGDPLRLYLDEVAGIPAAGDVNVLSAELVAGKRDVQEQLANLLLSRAVAAAQEYVGEGVLLLDLIQEASLGLWQGIQTYTDGDIEKHCDWWIHQHLAGAVVLQARDSGMGQKLRQALEDYRSVDEKLLAELGRNPTLEEISQALHITEEEANTVADMLQNARVLQHVKQPEPEQLPQEEDQAVEDTAYFQMRQRIQELLSGLSERDAKLLSLRYGLEGGLPLDPQQTGLKLGLTAQEVIKREAAALAKLRQ